jgi:hypothetical protein
MVYAWSVSRGGAGEISLCPIGAPAGAPETPERSESMSRGLQSPECGSGSAACGFESASRGARATPRRSPSTARGSPSACEDSDPRHVGPDPRHVGLDSCRAESAPKDQRSSTAWSLRRARSAERRIEAHPPRPHRASSATSPTVASAHARRIDCQVLAEELAPLEVAWSATDPSTVTGRGSRRPAGYFGAASTDTSSELLGPASGRPLTLQAKQVCNSALSLTSRARPRLHSIQF